MLFLNRFAICSWGHWRKHGFNSPYSQYINHIYNNKKAQHNESKLVQCPGLLITKILTKGKTTETEMQCN